MSNIFYYFKKKTNICNNRIFNHYLKNINTINDAVRFLKYLSTYGYNSSDEIMDKVYSLFLLFLPSERYLQKLSILQQSVQGMNNIEDFAMLTIWICANLAIIDNEKIEKLF